jgi:hypothetical protein
MHDLSATIDSVTNAACVKEIWRQWGVAMNVSILAKERKPG